MGRLASNQRVVRSIKDRSGNAYTKTSAGGKARATSAAKYMDQKEEKDLYRYDKRSGLAETTRHEVAEFIERTDTRCQQHMAFTTQVRGTRPCCLTMSARQPRNWRRRFRPAGPMPRFMPWQFTSRARKATSMCMWYSARTPPSGAKT
ncbi:hypothetical protein D3875_00385 [Deinococcus cavernae]|uniref:Uncharacterized protein n=1 Tax=Deinococcus cavernae TaxID=2320857 RepID=A0A418VIJ2_9DEIO|nr:hypothetical protein D3875_00385 [Deinococcus cavernae]